MAYKSKAMQEMAGNNQPSSVNKFKSSAMQNYALNKNIVAEEPVEKTAEEKRIAYNQKKLANATRQLVDLTAQGPGADRSNAQKLMQRQYEAEKELKTGRFDEDLTLAERLQLTAQGIGESYNAAPDIIANTVVQAVKGDKKVNMQSDAMKAMQRASQASQQATYGMGKTGQFLWNVGASVVENASMMPLAVLPGGQTAILGAMGAKASAQKMAEVGEKGDTAKSALLRGVTSGAIEGITEKIGFDNAVDIVLKNTGEGIIKDAINQALAEGGEETLSYLANLAVDKLAKDPDAKFSLKDLGASALGGALAGGVMGTGASLIGGNIRRNNIKSQPNDAETVSNDVEKDKTLSKNVKNPQNLSNNVENGQVLSNNVESATDINVATTQPKINTENTAASRMTNNTAQAETQQNEAVPLSIERFGEEGKKLFANVQNDAQKSAEFDKFYQAGQIGSARPTTQTSLTKNEATAAYMAGIKDGKTNKTAYAQKQYVVNREAGLDLESAKNISGGDRIVMNTLGKAFGKKIVVVPNLGNVNAKIDNSKGIIYIAENAQNGVRVALAHEVVHDMRIAASEEFDQLAKAVLEFKQNFKDYDADIAKTAELYGLDKGEIDYYDTLEEVVADFIADKAGADRLVSMLSQDKTLAQKFAEAVRNAINKLSKLALDKNTRVLVNDWEDLLKKLDSAVKATEVKAKAEADRIYKTATSSNKVTTQDKERLSKQFAEDDGTRFVLDESTGSVYIRESRKSFEESVENGKLEIIKQLYMKNPGVTEVEANKYIASLKAIADYIGLNSKELDYEPDRDFKYLKDNSDYGFTADSSSNCIRRKTFQDTLDMVLKTMKDNGLTRTFTKDDYMMLRRMLVMNNYKAGCGVCYVDGARMQFGEMTNKLFKKHPELKGKYTYYDFMTQEGQVKLAKENKDLLNEFIKINGSQNRPMPFEARTDYRNELYTKYTNADGTVRKADVNKVNEHGGFRVQSFSDFELVNALDLMQVIFDAGAVGLKGQAYSKVIPFFKLVNGTNLMSNISVFGKGTGLDANGNLDFDNVQGVPIEIAKEIRNSNDQQFGICLVGNTVEHIIKAMATDYIDYVIPFHRSQIKYADFAKLDLKGNDDFTLIQLEKVKDPNTGRWRNPKTAEERALIPVLDDWWDYNATPEQNARNYLELCHERGIKPKFIGAIGSKAKGTQKMVNLAYETDDINVLYSDKLPIREGYYKLLIDFRRYDNNGNAIEQKPVVPNFNVDVIKEMLSTYKYEGSPTDANYKNDAVPAIVSEFISKFGDKKPTEADILNYVGEYDEYTSIRNYNEEAKADVERLYGNVRESKKLGKYADINVDVQKNYDQYNIDDSKLEDYIYIQRTVYDKLENDGFFDENGERKVINADTGIEVVINYKGVKETFGPKYNYGYLSKIRKKMKIATIEYVPELIKYGELVKANVPNYHNNKSDLLFDEIEHPVKLDNEDYIVKIKIRKSRDGNKFWVHKIFVDNKKSTETSSEQHNLVAPIKSSVDSVNSVTDTIEIGNGKKENTRESKKTEPDIPEGYKERGFAESTRTKSTQADEVKQDFIDNPDFYKQLANKTTREKAEAILAKGLSFAEAEFPKLLERFDPVAVPLADMMAKEYSKMGEHDKASNVIREAGQKLTKAGQFSQAAAIMLLKHNPMAALSYAQREIDKLNVDGKKTFGKKWKDFELTDAEVEMFKNIKEGDGEAIKKAYKTINKRLSKEYPSTFWQKFVEASRISMLLNPRTNAKNIVSNMLLRPVTRASGMVSAKLQQAYRYYNKDYKPTQAVTVSKETKKLAEQIWDNIKDTLETTNKYNEGIKAGTKDIQVFKEGIGTRVMENIAPGTLHKLNNLMGKEDAGLLETMRNGTYWLLEWGDNKYVKKNFLDRLGSYLEAQGIDSVTDANQETIDAAVSVAYKEALRATFKDDTALSNWMASIKHTKSPYINALMELIMPFTKTPANIAMRGIDYSPIGLLNTITKYKQGDDISEVIDELSKNLLGSALIAAGALLFSKGIVTGGELENEEQAAFLKQQGWLPYAVKVGDRYVTYDWAQPAAIPVIMGVTVMESLEEGRLGVVDAVKNAGVASFNQWIELSPLQSLQEIMGGYGTVGENLLNAAIEMPQRLIPSALGATARTADTTQRVTYSKGNLMQTQKDIAKSKVPGLSNTLPVAYDTWGNAKQRDNSTLGAAINQYINPSSTKLRKQNEVDLEIDRLYESVGDSAVYPRKADYTIKKDGTTYQLDNKEYSEYQRIMGELSYDGVSALLANESYYNMTDAEKAKVIKKIYENAFETAKYAILENRGYKKTKDDIKEMQETKIKKAYMDYSAKNIAEYYIAQQIFSNADSDKTKSGITIAGSKKKNGLNRLVKLGYSRSEAKRLYERLNGD